MLGAVAYCSRTEETGREMNRAIAGGVSEGLGMGEALGRWLELGAHPQARRKQPAAAGLPQLARR